MFRACGRDRFAMILEQVISQRLGDDSVLRKEGYAVAQDDHLLSEESGEYRVTRKGLLLSSGRRKALGSFNNHLVYYKTRRRIKNIFEKTWRFVEGACRTAFATGSDPSD
jgi:hypothetical protein